MRRKISYDILEPVLNQKQHAHRLLQALDLEPQDQAFVSALVYTVLENKLYLEYQLQHYIKKTPNPKLKVLLLMGACELLLMETKAYAVVNEYVDLAKKLNFNHQTGFVNSVLKNVSEKGLLAVSGSELEIVSIEKSVPIWILKLLKSQYSEDFALDYANYIQEIKPIYGWINHLKYDQDSEKYLDNKVVDKQVFNTDLIKKSNLIIQDINSQKVIDDLPIEVGMDILDCCCAPGTKTLKLANRLNNTGRLIGVDIAPRRVEITHELMENANVKNATILQGDATTLEFEHMFDIALIDAPCSGLGVIAHKHDLRYNVTPEDLDDLQVIQKGILRNISQYVKVEGLLVYSTCTLNKKENEKQIEAFLKDNDNFECIYQETMDPIISRGDGFYVAHLLRKW